MPAITNRLAALISTTGAVVIMAILLSYSRYGFDFTDEGFYLNWLSTPALYTWSLTQFGFVYHPLYWLLNGDVAWLRSTNLLITFLCAWCLSAAILRTQFDYGGESRFGRLAVSAGMAITSLVIFSSWLVTPSYNSLALQALLLCSAGLLLATQATDKSSALGWVLIGVGGWLALMAKPSSAFAVACIAFIYLVATGKLWTRMLALGVFAAVVPTSLTAFAIDGSLMVFFQRLNAGVEFASYLGGGHTIAGVLRLDDFAFTLRQTYDLLAITAIIFLTTILSFHNHLFSKVIFWLICSIGMFATLGIAAGWIDTPLQGGVFQGLQIWALPLSALLIAIFPRRNFLMVVKNTHLPLAVALAVMPYAYAFGTNGNYWIAGTYAGIFWALTGLVLLAPLASERQSWALLLPFIITSQFITSSLLQAGLRAPYRQPEPLSANTQAVALNGAKSRLILSADFARYIDSAKTTATIAGLKHGTPLIDLTGQSPGLLYALHAEAVGQAWMIGGYPGSQALAQAAMARVPCGELASAWVLKEPDGPRALPTDVLKIFGADLNTDYEPVGRWSTAKGAGGYPESRSQVLYKPKRQTAVLSACLALQGKGSS